MNRVERGTLLLIIAGGLSLVAVAAYAIHDAEDRSRRMEADLARRALNDQARRSLAEMKTIRDHHSRGDLDREQAESRQAEILERLRRIEAKLGAPGSPAPAR